MDLAEPWAIHGAIERADEARVNSEEALHAAQRVESIAKRARDTPKRQTAYTIVEEHERYKVALEKIRDNSVHEYERTIADEALKGETCEHLNISQKK